MFTAFKISSETSSLFRGGRSSAVGEDEDVLFCEEDGPRVVFVGDCSVEVYGVD